MKSRFRLGSCKERALAEYYRTLARYPTECGDPITYQVSEEQLKQVLCGEVTVDELIGRGEVSERQD